MSFKSKLARLLYWFKGFQEDPEELLRRAGIEGDDKVLEVGCATGFYTFALSTIADRVCAVDISEDLIQYVEKESDNNVTTICTNAERLKIDEDSVDKIVCFNTLHEMPDPEKALKVWISFLKERGEFLYRDLEISAEDIPALSDDRLRKVRVVEDIHLFRIIGKL